MIQLRKRNSQSNKSHFPKILIAAGSPTMPGAGILAARAAFKMGAAYVYHYHPKGSDFLLNLVPEIIPIKSFSDATYDAILMGSGCTIKDIDSIFFQQAIDSQMPLVLDAGALDYIAQNNLKLHFNTLITPHMGEAKRILNSTLKEAKEICLALTKKYNCHSLLKGSPNYIANKKEIIEVFSGNASLATAGSGDVLAGIITAALAHVKTTSVEQIKSCVEFHGQLAKNYCLDKSLHSLSASDLIEQIALLLDSYCSEISVK